MGMFTWLRKLISSSTPVATNPQSLSPDVSLANGEHWRALCTAAGRALVPDDADALWSEVEQALNEPEHYFSRFADDLAQRGIESPDAVSPWLALVDGLQRREQVHEMDWKLDMGELIWGLQQLQFSRQREISLDALAGSKAMGHDALTEAGAHLRSQGVALVTFDIDSDSYPLSLLAQEDTEPLEELAKRVGRKLIAL